MTRPPHRDLVRRLMTVAGTTYAQDARITVRDKPMPLFHESSATRLTDIATMLRDEYGGDLRRRATDAARDMGLPAEPAALGALAPRSTATLAAALVRVSLDDDMRAELVA